MGKKLAGANLSDLMLMNRNSKDNEITFIDVALDCCAYYYLIMFWLIFLLFPLLFIIIYLYKDFAISGLFIIICILCFPMSLIPYYVSKGIIERRKLLILIGVLLSIYLAYNQIILIKDINKTGLINVIGLINPLLTLSILIISLFIKRIYRKK
jgi:hypothetical protein